MSVAGILFGYLRLVSNSIWPAVIAHGIFNVYWTLFIAFTVSGSLFAREYLAGESGILTIAGIGVLAILFIRDMEKGTQDIVFSPTREGLIVTN